MSGMREILNILLDRDAFARHEPECTRGPAARDATVP
jgi:hypothetical protein